MIDFNECPCSGKNMTTLVAPWILLTLYLHQGTHGYEIQKMIQERLRELGLTSNIAGLYRHLKTLEKRGLVRSVRDTGDSGPARRPLYLTDAGKECLSRWIKTLRVQMGLIDKLLNECSRLIPGCEGLSNARHRL